MATPEKNFKIIVFDFDETLYFHPRALEFYVEFIKNAICSLSSHSEEEAMRIIRDYGFDQRGEKRVSFAKTCGEFGVDAQAWDVYKTTHFFEVDYNSAYTVDNRLLKALSKEYTLAILSNELYEHILYKAERLGINLSVFDRIYAPGIERGILSLNKKKTYKRICEDYCVTPQQILAIGDRYQVDIAPLVELGGNGIQISSTKDIEALIQTELLKPNSLRQ